LTNDSFAAEAVFRLIGLHTVAHFDKGESFSLGNINFFDFAKFLEHLANLFLSDGFRQTADKKSGLSS